MYVMVIYALANGDATGVVIHAETLDEVEDKIKDCNSKLASEGVWYTTLPVRLGDAPVEFTKVRF